MSDYYKERLGSKPWSLPGDDAEMTPEETGRMMVNRTSLQETISNEIAKTDISILQWATGVGKTRAALLALCKKFKKGDSTATILVPQNIMISNWKEEIAGSLGNSRIIDGKTPDNKILLDKIEKGEISFKTYQALSIGNVSNEKNPLQTDILIMDEGHHAFGKDTDGISSKANAALKTIKTKSVIVLSATLTNEPETEEEEIIRTLQDLTSSKEEEPFRSVISLQKAVNDKLLPQPYLLIHELLLDDIPGSFSFTVTRHGRDNDGTIIKQTVTNKEQAIAMWQDTEAISYLELTYTGTAKNAYETISALIGSMTIKIRSCNNAEAARGMVSLQKHLGDQRKRLLGKMKTEYARNLLENLLQQHGDRVICFTSSVAQAIDLGGEGHSIYSENRTTEQNDDIIAAFNRMTAGNDIICSAGMGVEGINFKNITSGVLIQLEGAVRRNIQKQGRGLRSINPKTHVIYIRGTKDDEWLGTFLEATEIEPDFIYKHTARHMCQYKDVSDFVKVNENFQRNLISAGRSHKKVEDEEAQENKQLRASGIFPINNENYSLLSGVVVKTWTDEKNIVQTIKVIAGHKCRIVTLPPLCRIEESDIITAIGIDRAFGQQTFKVEYLETVNGKKLSKT